MHTRTSSNGVRLIQAVIGDEYNLEVEDPLALVGRNTTAMLEAQMPSST